MTTQNAVVNVYAPAVHPPLFAVSGVFDAAAAGKVYVPTGTGALFLPGAGQVQSDVKIMIHQCDVGITVNNPNVNTRLYGEYIICSINTINTNVVINNSGGLADEITFTQYSGLRVVTPTQPIYTSPTNVSPAFRIQVIRLPQYNNVTITATGSITCPRWSEATYTGGIVCFFVKDKFEVFEGGMVNAKGKGYTPGSGGLPGNRAAAGLGGLGGAASVSTGPNTGGGDAGHGTDATLLLAHKDVEGGWGIIKCGDWKGGDGGYGGDQSIGGSGFAGSYILIDRSLMNSISPYSLIGQLENHQHIMMGWGGKGGNGAKVANSGGGGGGGGGSKNPGGNGTNGSQPDFSIDPNDINSPKFSQGGDGGYGGGAIYIIALNYLFHPPLNGLSYTIFDASGENGANGIDGAIGGKGGDGGNGSDDLFNVGKGGGGGPGVPGDGGNGGHGGDGGQNGTVWLTYNSKNVANMQLYTVNTNGNGGDGGNGGNPGIPGIKGQDGNSQPSNNYCPYYANVEEECNCEEAYKLLATTNAVSMNGTNLMFTDVANNVECWYDLSLSQPVLKSKKITIIPSTPTSGTTYLTKIYYCEVTAKTDCDVLFSNLHTNFNTYSPNFSVNPTDCNFDFATYSFNGKVFTNNVLQCADVSCVPPPCKLNCSQRGLDGKKGMPGQRIAGALDNQYYENFIENQNIESKGYHSPTDYYVNHSGNQVILNHSEAFNPNEFSIYPNPAKHILYVSSNFNSLAHVRVLSMNGTVVYEHELEQKQEISVSTWPAGLYIVEVMSATGVHRQKITVIK